MNSTDTHLIEIAKRYMAICIQVSQAYKAEQSKLALDQVLSYDRLSTPVGTQESLAAVESLSVLTSAHKAAMEKIFLACTTDLSEALSALPESRQAEYRAGLLRSLHGQLASQSQFYENRGEWIEAARNICNLIESRRETARFEAEGVVFADSSDHERFESLLATVEETHTLELIHMKQTLDHFSESAALLGINTP
jgi:hypothetical protein